jgi:carnitine 3-dehydrogenase
MSETPSAVAIIGFGVIGLRWAAAFAHAGVPVRAYDPQAQNQERFAAERDGLLRDLDALYARPSPPAPITFHAELAAALDGAGFVQESIPEQLALKQEVLPRLEEHLSADIVIASSSSALFVSDMQRDCRHPERIVLGHPFNPAHLMPLVEVVGGQRTAPEALQRARAVYEAIGKKPVVLNREVTGHLALRLMAAMWREAIALVASGVATVEDIDRAFCYGPGPKWTLQGAFISNHLNAADMTSFLAIYGPTYEAIWADLAEGPPLTEAARAAVIAGTKAAVAGRDDASLRAERDAGLVQILSAQNRHGAL